MELLQDLRYALRSLRRSPGFTAVAVASVALGIGANTAIFSLVKGVLLSPLPFTEPDRLYVVRERLGNFVKLFPSAAANVRHYIEWRENARSFDSMGAAYFHTMNLTGSGEPERLGAMQVSANFFDVLGVKPRIGRTFQPHEEQPGNDRVILVTDGLWKRRFGADPNTLGRTIQLDGAAYTVIGIMPEEFRLPRSEHLGGVTRYGTGTTVFRPFGLDMSKQGPMGEHDYLVVGRLKHGISPQQAKAELDAIQTRIKDRYAKDLDLTAILVPFQEHVTSAVQRSLWVLMAAVGAVLLIVCANLANLMLVRALARSRETAIRSAVGAGSWHIVRLMFVEAGSIAVAGGALGALIATWCIDLFTASAPAGLPRVDEVRVDSAVLLFAFGVAAVSALLFGVVPAWHALRSDPGDVLRGGTHNAAHGRRGRRTREVLVGVEVAVSAVLLVVAGLLITSLAKVLNVDKGFNTESALSVEVELRKAAPEAERERLINDMVARAGTLPGVVSVAASTVLPLEGTAHVNYARREGDNRGVFQLPLANYRYVTPSYVATLQMPLKRGRWLTPEDRNREVIVISENLGNLLWPGEDPIGKRLQYSQRFGFSEVVGVVADARAVRVDRDPMTMAYLPIWKRSPPSFSLIVRTASDPAALAAAVRSEVFAVDPQAVVARIRTLERVLSDSLAARRFQLTLISAFAVTALILASLGIYGVVSYSVARRKTEIGIRIALGAALTDVHRLVLRQGMRPVVLGLMVGVGGALAAGRLVESLLFGTRSTDPLTFAVVVAVLFGAGLLACYVPASRATRMDPASALRHE